MAGHRLHPLRRRFRQILPTVVAKWSWLKLAVIFFCIVVAASILLSVLRAAVDRDFTLGRIIQDTPQQILILIDAREASDPADKSISGAAFALFAGFMKAILIVGLLGTVVFKFFIIPDVFVHRSKISIHRQPDGGNHVLTVRFYNVTSLEVVDLEFSAYLRAPQVAPNGAPSVPNTALKIREGRDCWPIALQYVPFSIFIDLESGDVIDGPDGKVLHAIQRKPVGPKPVDGPGETFLVIIIRGKTPEIGSEIIETIWYRLSGENPEFEFGKFEEIHTVPGSEPKLYGGTPRKWKGWDRFDNVEPNV